MDECGADWVDGCIDGAQDQKKSKCVLPGLWSAIGATVMFWLATVLFRWRQDGFGMHLQPYKKLAAKMNACRSGGGAEPQLDIQAE